MAAGFNAIAILSNIVLCWFGAVNTACVDIDTKACQLMLSQRPDVCTDPVLSATACPRFCKLCPVECYHCDTSVTDFHMCNTTKTCAKGEVCMQKQLLSSNDGHVEYQLTCATQQACDGLGLTITFGKRSVQSRDVSVSCCASDLCNLPYEESTTIKTSPTPTTITTTSVQACRKDVLVLVDETSSLAHYVSDITGFLENVVRQLNIGNNNVLISLATFDVNVTKHWDFDDYTNSRSLQNAIARMRLKGTAQGDLNSAIKYAVGQINSGSDGNRVTAPDVVLIVTDDGAKTAFLESLYERELHTRTDNVIAIGIGRQITSAEIEHLATDSHHDFSISRPQNLAQLTDEVALLICEN